MFLLAVTLLGLQHWASADTVTSGCHPAIATVTGGEHTCALLSSGRVKCWGGNNYGQLGQGDASSRGGRPGQMGDALPYVDLGSNVTVTNLNAGYRHTCALFSSGRIKCWGDNYYGQLGLGDVNSRGDRPGQMGDALPYVDLGSNVTAISVTAGAGHTCALLSNGRVKCWGVNYRSQLGLGDTEYRGERPGQMGDALPYVDLGSNVTVSSITTWWSHTCALLISGRIKCWGYNEYGQLGQGDENDRGGRPGHMGDALPYVNLGSNVTAISVTAGSSHICALLSSRRIKCWGTNLNGQLGLGDRTTRGNITGQMGSVLPYVDLGSNVLWSSISAGYGVTCALRSNGHIKCWGINNYGQLGLEDDYTRGDRPEQMGDALPYVNLGSNVTVVSVAPAGELYTCALLDNGRIKCWGFNSNGQLGLGDAQRRGGRVGQMGDALPYVDLLDDDRGCAPSAPSLPPSSAPVLPPAPSLPSSSALAPTTLPSRQRGASAAAIGGAVSGAAALLVICAVVVWWRRHKREHACGSTGSSRPASCTGPPFLNIVHNEPASADSISLASSAGSSIPTRMPTSSRTELKSTSNTVSQLQLPAAACRAPCQRLHLKGGALLQGVAQCYGWVQLLPPDACPWQETWSSTDSAAERTVVQLTPEEVAAEVKLVEDRLLGTGATAVVYQCLWPKRFGPSALLAAKVLKDASSSTAIKSFEHEARVLGHLRHRNVVRIYGYCLEPPCMVIIMELLPTSLRDALYARSSHAPVASPTYPSFDSHGPWPTTVGAVLQVAIDIAQGVEHLHSKVNTLTKVASGGQQQREESISRFFVHRDLKPGNVLIGVLGHAKLSDFGLARPNTSTNTVDTEACAGTLRYMAPEVLGNTYTTQLLQLRRKVSTKVDIYSLGMIMWELVAKQVPWTGMPDMQVPFIVAAGARPPFVSGGNVANTSSWMTHQSHSTTMASFRTAASSMMQPTSLSQVATFSAMPAYVDLIIRCWQADPEQRPPAMQVVQELQCILSQLQDTKAIIE